MMTKMYRMRAACEPTTSAQSIAARSIRNVVTACAVALAASIVLSIAMAMAPGGAGDAQAQRMIQFASAKRTTSISVAVGKSDDVHTDSSFVDILVGNPEIADVNPLTDRSLSILGKKIGTTRVSLYGEGKTLVGVFDIEVSYDVSKLAEEIALRFPQAKVRISTANGRVLLSGTVPDGVVLDTILSVARQFGPDIINSMQVAQPQQVMLEVRFVEAARSAGRELGCSSGTRSAKAPSAMSATACRRASFPSPTAFSVCSPT